MTADYSPPLSAEEWCRTFVIAIRQLADDRQLQPTDWAIRAQAQHGHRNPVEVAHEEWTADGMRELSLKGTSGESIPMTAPILMDESVTTKGIGKAYYLAILPDAIEVISFIDRCTRGVEQLSAQIRRALDRRNH